MKLIYILSCLLIPIVWATIVNWVFNWYHRRFRKSHQLTSEIEYHI